MYGVNDATDLIFMIFYNVMNIRFYFIINVGNTMSVYFGIVTFIFGTIIGSFLNVCIYRVPRGESIVYPPSHCTNCNNSIKWYDLIPIISYIFLRGKCRYCNKHIPIRYPIVELVTGLLYVMIYIKFGFGIEFAKYIVFTSIMIVIGMIDLDTTDVYFKISVIGVFLAVIFLAVYHYNGLSIINYIYGGALGGGLLAFIIVVTKGGMGWGDMEICLICGLFLGFKLTFVMLFFSFIIGALIGVLLILSKKKSAKDYIPFGPFVAIAAIFTMLCGQNILNLYL